MFCGAVDILENEASVMVPVMSLNYNKCEYLRQQTVVAVNLCSRMVQKWASGLCSSDLTFTREDGTRLSTSSQADEKCIVQGEN